MLELKSFASRIRIPVEEEHFSKIFLDIHDSFNKEKFDDNLYCYSDFENFINIVYDKYGIKRPYIDSLPFYNEYSVPNNNKVLLGFSGGLDSVAQLLLLKEQNYEVIPYSMFNVNFYENGQGNNSCKRICEKLNISLVQSNFIRCMDNNNPYHKFWNENPIKNQMIMATMIDYCIENGIQNISLGDDLDLNLKDSVNGTNTTDSHEITESFMDGMYNHVHNLKFIPMKKGFNKLERIKLLMKYGLENEYYSCVLPGKFNQMRHNGNMKKFNIELFGKNCGCSCRKCSHHNLMLHYGNVKSFPDEFINACWKRLGDKNSADYEFFRNDLPLEVRIRNLFEY